MGRSVSKYHQNTQRRSLVRVFVSLPSHVSSGLESTPAPVAALSDAHRCRDNSWDSTWTTRTSFDHSFAASFTSPIFNLGPYFCKTLALWYFQNCLEESFPAILFRILGPPGCSSRNSKDSVSQTCGIHSGWTAQTRNIVHPRVDDDPHAVGLILVLGHLGCRVLL